MTGTLEFGLDTFGDVTRGPDGAMLSQAQVLRNVVAEGVLADRLGVDFFGVGEHHRADFAISAPEVVLAAIASQTSRIRLGSAVTVLSSDDPIRVFQRFSTLHAISGGRAEAIMGRGSFIESFPLFGYELSQYETLFAEKLDLFVHLLRERAVTWRGTIRPPLTEQSVFPPLDPEQPLRTWVAVGGTPESVLRAAHYDLPLMLAVIGGEPARFRPFVDLYHETLTRRGAAILPVGLHSMGYIAETDAEAREALWPCYRDMHARIGRERGWPPLSRAQFDRECDVGSLYVGAPATVVQKIAASVRALGVSRFQFKYSIGELSHERIMRCIELYGTQVVPLVREHVAAPELPAAVAD